MKYIKLKDCVATIEYVENHCYYCNLYSNPQLTNKGFVEIRKNCNRYVQIPFGYGKESDNLEELCDEFIYRDLYNYKISKNIIDMLDNKDKIKFYGAIWTEWGLKYVAKMNDKGELELL